MTGLSLPVAGGGANTTEVVELPLFRDWSHEWPVTAAYYWQLTKDHLEPYPDGHLGPNGSIGYHLLELWAWLAENPEKRRAPDLMRDLVPNWIDHHTRELTPLRVRLPEPRPDIELEALRTTARKLGVQRR